MTQNLKSIQSYLDRRQARRDTVRDAAQKWTIMLVSANAVAAITLANLLTDPEKQVALGPFQKAGLGFALLMFAIALLPSIMGAVALGMAPKDRAIQDQPVKDVKATQRNLYIGSIGFIIGLACVIGAISSLALQVISKSL